MYFEAFRSDRGCMSYLVGCEKTHAAIVVDPAAELVDGYLAATTARGLRLHTLLDTHTHADHFSALRGLGARLGLPTAMHRSSPAPFVDIRLEDGESLIVGELRLRVLHTPGHTLDSICVVLQDRMLTGDTLLLGATGRTDLPTGDPEALWDSLFGRIQREDPALLVYPAHNYKSAPPTPLGEQFARNPRLQARERETFVAQMKSLDLSMPEHLTEALRTNCSGGLTVDQLIAQAAARISFMSLDELQRRVASGAPGLEIVDVREAEAYRTGRVPGARHLPRGQLELRVDDAFPDPTVRILLYCEFGKISTLAAGTLHSMGFRSAIALDGGFRRWSEAGFPVER